MNIKRAIKNGFFIGMLVFSLLIVSSTIIHKPTIVEVPVESNLTDIVQQTIDSVVHIENVTQGWQGSGVVIKPDLIVTARHVVENGDDFAITLNDGTILRSQTAISSKKYDIGFIKLDGFFLKPLEFDSIWKCKLGQQVYVIGSPYGKENFNSVTLGIISGLDRNWDFIDYGGEDYGWSIAFTTDSAAYPGNSGSPVFSMDGKVRGILVGGLGDVLNCVLPADLFLSDIEEIEVMFVQDKYQFEEGFYIGDY